MQLLDGALTYSATDLNNFLECGHMVSLERSVATGMLVRPVRDDTVELIAAKGIAHEKKYLASVQARYGEVVEIRASGTSRAALLEAEAETLDAMGRGVAAIYQGTFFDGTFVGKSDFLFRVAKASARWPWSYEVSDTKLALHDKPYFVIQLCHYSEHLERLQGIAPTYMHVVLGNDIQKSFRFEDFAAYYRHLKTSFLEQEAAVAVYPFKCSHCVICDWSDTCIQRREHDDHLSLVAWMRRDQVKVFEAAGISTLAQLATATRPAEMQQATFERLHRQAALQFRARETGQLYYELLDPPLTEGFGALPAPAVGDVFFDMEGDQFFELGVGLEYLFGFYCPDDEMKFRAFWGTDRAGEKAAFEQSIDFIVERRKRYPLMHVYHYAPYEKTALRTLALRHDTREEDVDELLRDEILVDLYAIVRQSLALSQSSYSIKKLEPFYGMVRTADVRRGDDSIIMFERWLQDTEQRQHLYDIERYNEEDCCSTWMLRNWILDRRAEYIQQRGVALAFRSFRTLGQLCHEPADANCKKCAKRISDEYEVAKISDNQRQLLARDGDECARLLGHLLSYHRREEKPVWWALFDRCENSDELFEDKEAIAGLEFAANIPPYKIGPKDRNDVYSFRFPEQSYNLGDSPYDPATKRPAGEIVGIDVDENLLRLKSGFTLEAAVQLHALVPGGPVVAAPQKLALARIASLYLAGSLSTKHPSTLDLLGAAYPRLCDRAVGETLQPNVVSPDLVYAVVSGLDRSYLVVQGPPGTGKTYAGARVIARLLGDGKRVGVMANSHKAIHNILHEIEHVAHVAPHVGLRGLHKHSKQNSDSPYVSRLSTPAIVSRDDNAAAETGDFNLISGNAWLFARAGMVDRLDYLFIDEAGQTSLADAIAVSPSGANLVLLGDPMQLAQVSKSSHGANAGRSILEHLLGEQPTVPADRGILLDMSYRMQPDICNYISQTMYDDRLRADPKSESNRVTSDGLCGSGLRYLPIEHFGNGRESPEETERIVVEIKRLLGGTFTRKDEGPAPITEHDILVVTPYNAQRTRVGEALRAAGHHNVRVGTVDKFQGQEAPVVFYSMATSTGDDLPRNMEFLFEKNRFNVAISRAQCLSVLICSPHLFDVRCNNVEQMALLNVICRYVEAAS
jgi:predicted RecB family nuclease